MARAPRRIDGLGVAITGGARGIGLATAQALAARGARVAIGDLDAAEAERAAGAFGGSAHPLDVSSRDSFRAFLDAAGPVDVLVNNAGGMHVGPFLSESEEWSRRQVDINLHGVVNGMQLALGAMTARGSGHVINVASAASKLGVRHEAVYAATKHAVYGLSDSVRQELRGSGVEITCVMPGLVRTQLSAGTTDSRGTVVLGPEDVAAAIVSAVERPRFDVFVPRSYGVLFKLVSPLPRPAREAVLRAVGSERGTRRTTRADRAAYEERMERMTPR